MLLVCTSCIKKYKANVKIEYCTGKMDTINIVYYDRLQIVTHEQAVPLLQDYWNNVIKYNVCEYRILSQTKL